MVENFTPVENDPALIKEVDKHFANLLGTLSRYVHRELTPKEVTALTDLKSRVIKPIEQLNSLDSVPADKQEQIKAEARNEIDDIKEDGIRLARAIINGEDLDKLKSEKKPKEDKKDRDGLAIAVDLIVGGIFSEYDEKPGKAAGRPSALNFITSKLFPSSKKYTARAIEQPVEVSPLSPLVTFLAAESSQIPMPVPDGYYGRLKDELLRKVEASPESDHGAKLADISRQLQIVRNNVRNDKDGVITVIDVAVPELPALDFAFRDNYRNVVAYGNLQPEKFDTVLKDAIAALKAEKADADKKGIISKDEYIAAIVKSAGAPSDPVSKQKGKSLAGSR